MPKLTLIGLYFWLYVAQKVVSGDDLYHKVGGELVLKPDKTTVPDSITSIIWKHGKNKVAEWDKDFGGLDIYAAFKGRTTLDQTTGELRIIGLKNRDVGVYSVELNGKLLDKTYKLSVIKTVPKPTIAYTCNSNKTSCTLTCEGDTTDAEPVTYRWKVGEGAWEDGGKQLTVSKSDTGKSTNSYKYICKMKNSVSGEGEVSEPVGELFGPEPSEVNVGGIVGGVVVVVLVLLAFIIGFVVWKTGYTWIFSKISCGMCGGDEKTKTDGSAAAVGEDETKTDDSAAPVGKDDSKTDGSVAPVGEDETKTDGSVAPVGEDETKTDVSAAPVGEDETKTGGSAAPVGDDESKTDGSAAPVGEDESKTDGSAAPVGEDESKTDGSAATVGEDETKTDDSAAPVGDLNAAEKGEANGEGSVLLNEDRVKYHNDNGEGREEENSVL